jgi:hypothetical protein
MRQLSFKLNFKITFRYIAVHNPLDYNQVSIAPTLYERILRQYFGTKNYKPET